MCCRLLLGHLGQVLTDFRLEICYREGLRLLQGIYFADTNLTIFSNIFFHYSHLRSHDWQQEDCPKDSLFKVEKKTSGCFSVLVLLLLPHIELCVNPVCLAVPTKRQGFATTL